MATMHEPDNDAGSGAADLSNGPDVVSNPANDTVNAGRWADAVACPAHWKSRRRGAVEPVSLAIRSDKGVSAGIASVHRIVRSVEVGLLAGFAETADPRSGTARSRVAVAAYYDLTGDELAERIPVHHLWLFATDPSISRLPVLTVPALDSG